MQGHLLVMAVAVVLGVAWIIISSLSPGNEVLKAVLYGMTVGYFLGKVQK